MELETAARKHLLAQSTIKNLFQHRIYKFEARNLDDDGQLRRLEGTGDMQIVLERGIGWTKPHRNTGEFPILIVWIMADHSRDPDGRAVKLDAEDRALAGFREVDKVLHQKDGEHRRWPEGASDGLYVEGCFRGSDPAGPKIEGGVAVVRATYDVKCFHAG